MSTRRSFRNRAHIKAKKPDLGDQCNVARIELKEGKFVVSFADALENLSF